MRMCRFSSIVLFAFFVTFLLPGPIVLANKIETPGHDKSHGEANKTLQLLLQNVPNLTAEETQQLRDLAIEESGVEADLDRPSFRNNPEAIGDLNSRLADIGLQRIRVLAGDNARYFQQLRNSMNDSIGGKYLALDTLELALKPYIAKEGIQKVWTNELKKSCSTFRTESYYPVEVAKVVLESADDSTHTMLARFDTLLLARIIETRKAGKIQVVSEASNLFSNVELEIRNINGMAKQLNANTARAKSWRSGMPCPSATPSVVSN